MDIWTMVEAERRELADLAESLSDEQWQVQSLCDEWKVCDVVGHVFAVSRTSKLDVLAGMIRNGFNVDRWLARDGVAQGHRPRGDLVADLRSHAGSHLLPPMIKPEALLADTLVHAQDIRRPLGLPRDVPPDRLRVALDCEKDNRLLGVRKRVAGLRLVATDIDWSHGEGPEVRGTGEAILMTMLNRRAALADLTGEGVAALASRL